MAEEEKQYSLGAEDSPVDKRDWKAEAILSTEVDLPETLDLRDRCNAVRDQSGQGSCVAQSVAAIKEVQEYNEDGFEGHMSPQFIYNQRINQEGQGMYPRNAMDLMRKVGIVPEEDYPYGKIETPEKIDPKLKEAAKNYLITGYASVDTVDGLKLALFKNGPCMFTIPVYNLGRTPWKPSAPGQTITGGHAVTAVGYNKEGFILRNSWGADWADKGYTIFPYSDWGMHGEVWTTIDDLSSKPDPRFTKWYWKLWRYLKDYKRKYGSGFYMAILANIIFAVIGFTTKQYSAFILNGLTLGYLVVTGVIDFIQYKKVHR